MVVGIDLVAELDVRFAETDAAVAGGVPGCDLFRELLAGVGLHFALHLVADLACFFQGLLRAAVGGVGEELIEAHAAPVDAHFPSSDRPVAIRGIGFDAGDVSVRVR